jgi:hypothetical protein
MHSGDLQIMAIAEFECSVASHSSRLLSSLSALGAEQELSQVELISQECPEHGPSEVQNCNTEK